MESNPNQASDRKEDHISLAFRSATAAAMLDDRFDYDPVHGTHPAPGGIWPFEIAGRRMDFPFWVSSMTGGTARAGQINRFLARLCGEYKLGMGLGSCRKLLEDATYRADFSVREWMGDQPLFANLGVAQIEEWLSSGQSSKIREIMKITAADGLIVHINPLQELMQPEGDRVSTRPLDTIRRLLDGFDHPIIVKEVGQGMGPASLSALMALPLEAIEFGAFGGTNFSLLELLRDDPEKRERMMPLARIGHTAEQMVRIVNRISDSGMEVHTRKFIISGGVSDFMEAYYLMSLLQLPSASGMASVFLKHALISYESLQSFLEDQIRGLMIARSYLTIKESNR